MLICYQGTGQDLLGGGFPATAGRPLGPSPEYQHSANMAVLKNDILSDVGCGFETFYSPFDSSYYMVAMDSLGFRFYNVTDPFRTAKMGVIVSPNAIKRGQDAETKVYGDSVRLFMLTYDREILDVIIDSTLVATLSYPNNEIGVNDYHIYPINQTTPSGAKYFEMFYEHDGMLFIATNDSRLRYYDVSTPQSMDPQTAMIFTTIPSATGNPYALKNHEVKASTRSDGHRLVGVGMVRQGMRIVNFDESWNVDSVKVQFYDDDRTLLTEDIVINPHNSLLNYLAFTKDNRILYA
jgi:hypothetical protein